MPSYYVTDQNEKSPLRIRLCCISEWLNLNIFHFTHPAASRHSALFMNRTLLYDTDYQQLLCVVCVCVCVHVLQFQTVGIQFVSVFRLYVRTSCIFTSCYRSVIMDFGLLREDFWCLFVCQCEKIWQKLLSLTCPVDSYFGGWKLRHDKVCLEVVEHYCRCEMS